MHLEGVHKQPTFQNRRGRHQANKLRRNLSFCDNAPKYPLRQPLIRGQCEDFRLHLVVALQLNILGQLRYFRKHRKVPKDYKFQVRNCSVRKSL